VKRRAKKTTQNLVKPRAKKNSVKHPTIKNTKIRSFFEINEIRPAFFLFSNFLTFFDKKYPQALYSLNYILQYN
jgi:hypothetical protein